MLWRATKTFHNFVFLEFDGEKIYTRQSDCWYMRGFSMEYLIREGFKNLSEQQKNIMKPFETSFYVGDHDIHEYPVAGLKYTEKVLPCWSFDHWKDTNIEDYEAVCKKIEVNGRKPYQDSRIFWAGQFSHHRRRFFVDTYGKHPKVFVAALHDHWGHLVDKHGKQLTSSYIPIEDQTKFKYILDIEGWGFSARVKYLMFGNRPIFIQERAQKEYWMFKIEPFVHYIPVANDFRDFLERLEWAENNPGECEKIAKNAYDFALNNLTRKNAIERMSKILFNLGTSKEENLKWLDNKSYDLLIVIPVTFKNDKYLRRMFKFQKNFNFQRSVKLIFVADTPKPNWFTNSLINENILWLDIPDQSLGVKALAVFFNIVLKINYKWVLFGNDETDLDYEKLLLFLREFDHNKNIIISSQQHDPMGADIFSILRHMVSYHEGTKMEDFDLKDMFFTNCGVNKLVSKGFITKIKSYKYIQELIDFVNRFLPFKWYQVLYVLSKLVDSEAYFSEFLNNQDHNFAKEKSLNSYSEVNNNINFWEDERAVALFVVNDKPLSFIRLNPINRAVEVYSHPNEVSWAVNEKREIIFFNQKNQATSILEEVEKNKLYIGKSIVTGHVVKLQIYYDL